MLEFANTITVKQHSTSRMISPTTKPPRVLVLTDNRVLWEKFTQIVASEKVDAKFTYCFSYLNKPFLKEFAGKLDFQPMNVKEEWSRICREFNLVISLHGKQILPPPMVRLVRCINIHPGLNPYNRGWYPQVFSIINKLPLGATIHEIDERLDHGPIIDQEEVPVFPWDTSLSAYNRVIEAELNLLRKTLGAIVRGEYSTRRPEQEGNVNRQADFRGLCRLNVSETGTFGAFLDRLRALTHGEYHNAYFLDDRGRKIFVKVVLEPEDHNHGHNP